jgi:hypothetical protein
MVHTRLLRFISTKTKLHNYIKSFWQNCSEVIFAQWCFLCEYPLIIGENTVCKHCLEFLFDEAAQEEYRVILAPQGSALEKMLKISKPPFKQKQLLEALYLKYLLEQEASDKLVVYQEKIFEDFVFLKGTFPLQAFNHLTPWQDQEVIFITFRAPLSNSWEIYAQLSKARGFKLVCMVV